MIYVIKSSPFVYHIFFKSSQQSFSSCSFYFLKIFTVFISNLMLVNVNIIKVATVN